MAILTCIPVFSSVQFFPLIAYNNESESCDSDESLSFFQSDEDILSSLIRLVSLMNADLYKGLQYYTPLYEKCVLLFDSKGPFKCYVMQMEVGGCQIFRKKHYECVRFNVISVTRGWVGVQFPEKKRYVTLEWPLRSNGLDVNSHMSPLQTIYFCHAILTCQIKKATRTDS